jgi:hypothetical protein
MGLSDYDAGADSCGFQGFVIELHLHHQNVTALLNFLRDFAQKSGVNDNSVKLARLQQLLKRSVGH